MILAQRLNVESSTAKHDVGTRYRDEVNKKDYIYCVDSGAGITQYHAVTINSSYAATSLTKANADKNYLVGIAPITVTASYYFWCQVGGAGTLLVKSACASEALLYTTATAGTLDDASTDQTAIANINLTATAATAAASATAACYMNFPKAFAAETVLDVADSKAVSGAAIAHSAASSAMSAQSQGTSAALLAVSAASSAMSAQSQGTSAALLAVSAASSAMSAASSAMSAQSMGTSAALLAVSAASSAMSAQSMGTSAALLAVSAQSSASVAQSGVTKFILACSAYADSAVANSHSNAVSVAMSADAGFGEFVSTLASGISSAVGKAF